MRRLFQLLRAALWLCFLIGFVAVCCATILAVALLILMALKFLIVGSFYFLMGWPLPDYMIDQVRVR